MNTTIGTSQTSITAVGGSAASNQTIYIGRFVSAPIYQTSIAANTWSLSVAFQEESTTQNFPVSGTDQPLRINCYVWRPGGSKVGTILDGTTSSTADEGSANVERASNVTFSGSSVTIQNGDVIIIELWATGVTRSTSADMWFYYDGTTVTTTDGTVSNHASFLETPENLNFTSSITVTQTSIHKYNLIQNIIQTSIQKYNLRAFVAVTTSIQKYNLKLNVSQTSIHKYNLKQLILKTSIQKYNLKQNIVQTSINKYRILQNILQTSIQKYNLKRNILQTSIQKYNLKQNILQTSIQKYNLKRLVAQTSIHKYNTIKQILQTSIHKYNIFFAGTVLVSNIQKYNIRAIVAQTSKHKYHIRIVVAIVNSIQKYNILRLATQTTIHKYNLRKSVLQTTIHKYNTIGIFPSELDMTQTDTKTYANKFITKV